MTYLDNWLYSTLTPTTMIAIVAVFGYMIGKVKICGVSLDMAGVLLAAVLYGALSSRCQTISISGAQIFLYSEQFSANLSFLSGLGTALFISAVGIPGGEKLIGSRSRRNLQYLLTGVLTVLAGAVCILIISYIDGTVGFSGMIGIFSGALTSTPALAAAKEFPSVNVSELTVGYGASYVISVIGTVLFVQIILQKADESCHYKVDSDRH